MDICTNFVFDYGVTWNLMMKMDRETLKSMCQVNKLTRKIGNNPYFRAKYNETHPLGFYSFPELRLTIKNPVIISSFSPYGDKRYHICGTDYYTNGERLFIATLNDVKYLQKYGIKITEK